MSGGRVLTLVIDPVSGRASVVGGVRRVERGASGDGPSVAGAVDGEDQGLGRSGAGEGDAVACCDSAQPNAGGSLTEILNAGSRGLLSGTLKVTRIEPGSARRGWRRWLRGVS